MPDMGFILFHTVLVLSLLGKWTLLLLHLLCRGNKMVMKKRKKEKSALLENPSFELSRLYSFNDVELLRK